MITLEVLTGENGRRHLRARRSACSRIGRAPSTRWCLSDYHLSGEHGQIFREDDRYIYRDLRSTNGSRIQRGEQRSSLDGGAGEAPLSDGDQLLLGDPARAGGAALPRAHRGRRARRQAGGHRAARARRAARGAGQGRARSGCAPPRSTTSPRSSGGAGSICTRCSTAWPRRSSSWCPRPTHVAIDLADEPDGRINTVYARAKGSRRASAFARQPRGGAPGAARQGRGAGRRRRARSSATESVMQAPASCRSSACRCGTATPSAASSSATTATAAILRRRAISTW